MAHDSIAAIGAKSPKEIIKEQSHNQGTAAFLAQVQPVSIFNATGVSGDTNKIGDMLSGQKC
ncbi:hypothetical protein IJ750_07645 [bacterium]|nr:hypothetical protein [bacterium]